LPAIKRLQNKIEQSHWVQKLAEKLGVSQESVLEELKNIKTDRIYNPVDEAAKTQIDNKISSVWPDGHLGYAGRKKLIEDKIISLVLKNPENLNLIEESHYYLFCEEAKNLIGNIKNSALQRGNDTEAILADIPKNDYKNLLDTLALKAEVDYEEDGMDEIQLCLSQLKDIGLRNNLNDISGAVKLENDEQKRDELVREFNKKAKELHQV